MTEGARVSVVIPARNEGENIRPVLYRLFEQVTLPLEVLVVVDSADDTTVPVVSDYALGPRRGSGTCSTRMAPAPQTPSVSA